MEPLRARIALSSLVTVLSIVGCGKETAATPDAGDDGGVAHGGTDAGRPSDAGHLGTDAGTASFDAGTAAPPDAGVEAPDAGPTGLYVDPATGSDTASGLRSAPLRTIEHAAAIATAGQTITLMDGTYGPSTERLFMMANSHIMLADGVVLRAEHPGMAILQNGPVGTGSAGFVFMGSGGIEGVSFIDFPHVAEAMSGTLTFTGVLVSAPLLSTCGGGGNTAPFYIRGTATATIAPGHLTEMLGASVECYARTTDTARLVIRDGHFGGGVMPSVSGGTMFVATDTSTLELQGVTVENNAVGGAIAVNGATLIVRFSTFRNTPSMGTGSVMHVRDTAHLQVIGSTLEMAPSPCIATEPDAPPANVTVDVTDSTLENCRGGIVSVFNGGQQQAVITLTRSSILRSATHGISLGHGGNVTLVDSRIEGNSNAGIQFASANPYTLRARGSQIRMSGDDNIFFQGAAGSVLDLGRGNDPGNNDISGAGATSSAIRLAGGFAFTAYAVGNTWSPLQQGASMSGTYALAAPATTLDVTGPVATGGNYRITSAMTNLRLAEDPCVVTSSCP